MKYTERVTTDEVVVTVAVAVEVTVAVRVAVVVGVEVEVGVDGVTDGEPPVAVDVVVGVAVFVEPLPPVGVEVEVGVSVDTFVTGVLVGFDGPTGLLLPPFLPPHEAMTQRKGTTMRNIHAFFMTSSLGKSCCCLLKNEFCTAVLAFQFA